MNPADDDIRGEQPEDYQKLPVNARKQPKRKRENPTKQFTQVDAYNLRVKHHWSYEKIGKHLGIERHLASRWVRDEADVRAPEFADRRTVEIAESVEFYQEVALHYRKQMRNGDSHGNAGRYVCYARAKIDAVLGNLQTLKPGDVAPAQPAPGSRDVFAQDPGAMLRFAIALDPAKRDSPGSLLPYWDELRKEHMRRERDEGNL